MWLNKFKDSNGNELQPHEVQGYYQNKVKYKVKTVNDFISKLRKTAICDKFFSQNDLKFAGMQELFQKFFELTRRKLMEDPLLGSEEEIDHNMVEISNYVMFNLHSEFFYNQDKSEQEIKFQRKLEILEKLGPEAFGVKIEE